MDKNMKNEEGMLIVEATFILSMLIFFITLILSFGRVYMAQYYVTHSLLQTGQALGFKAYKFEEADEDLGQVFSDLLTGTNAKEKAIRKQWNEGNVVEAIKLTYKSAIVKGEEQLKSYGLEEGLASMDFTGTKKEEKTLFIKVSYKVRLPFGFFNHNYATLHQEIRTGLWSK